MARFNTALTSSSISGTATISTPYSGAFTEFTGTAPYTVTLPSPTLFPGTNQTFYNATSGQVTLSVSGATFNGTGGTGSATFVLNAGNVVSIFSDGTNYIVISEDGSPLTATTGSFSGNVTINGGSATLSVTAQTITLNPTGTSTIDNINIGSNTRGSGAFNTLAANQAVTFTANTASTGYTNGTLVVTGGMGVSGNIYSNATITGTNLAGTITTAAQANITSTGDLTVPSLVADTTTLVANKSNHRVGIGTASPTSQLEVALSNVAGSEVRVKGAAGFGIFLTAYTGGNNLSPSSYYGSQILYGGDIGATEKYWRSGTKYATGATDFVWEHSTTDQAYGTYPTSLAYNELLRLTSQGSLGVGTNSPATYGKLAVNGSTYINGNLTLTNTSMGNYGSTIQGAQTAASTGNAFLFSDSGGANVLTLAVGGNVGMGTQSPAYKLHVVGTAGIADPRITAVSATIASTATDVFVYDTSRDSDGGAWRKRTQHTSWYNETLNTATRGSRQDFPAVAVLVLTSSTLTIYDGDDPTLPMWMVFNFPQYTQATGNLGDTAYCVGYNGISTKSLSSVRIVNGKMFIGSNANYNVLWDVNFISEISYEYFNYPQNNTNLTRTRIAGTIIYRNSNIILQGSPTSRYGSDANLPIPTPTKFLALVVLRGARIDPLTQLPIPTVYVGSDAGVGVIKDDYTGRGYTYSYAAWVGKGLAVNKYTGRFLEVHTDGSANSVNGAYGAGIGDTVSGASPTFGTTWTSAYSGGSGWSGLGYPTLYWTPTANNIVSAVASVATPPGASPNTLPYITANYWGSVNANASAQASATYYPTWAVGGNQALSLISENPYNYRYGMVAHISTIFNSGWLQGNIKGAWMSSNSTTSLTYSNLIPNMTAANYSPGNGTLSNPNGSTLLFTITTASGQPGATYTTGTLTGGQTYYMAVTVVCSAAVSMRIQIAGIGAILSSQVTNTTTSTTIYGSFACPSSGTYAVQLICYSPVLNATISMTNFILALADDDRSSASIGLTPSGTIAKTLVNTSADLVGYGPFSNGNYLYQPYQSALDFGTGDFCYMGWVKHNWIGGTAGCILQRGPTVNSNEFVTYIDTDGSVKFRVLTSANTLATGAGMLPTNQWAHLAFTRLNGVTQIWINGIVHATGASTETMTQSTYALNLGQWTTNNGYWINGGMALWRVSATVPSAEQMAKIWFDENQLFQQNAKATLY